MKPKPRGWDVYLSFIITESTISPYWPKCLTNVAAQEIGQSVNETELTWLGTQMGVTKGPYQSSLVQLLLLVFQNVY